MRRRSTAPKQTAEEKLAPKLARAAADTLSGRVRVLRAAYTNAPALAIPDFSDVAPWAPGLLRHGKGVLGEDVMAVVYGLFVDTFFEYSRAFSKDGVRNVSLAVRFANETRHRWESLVSQMAFYDDAKAHAADIAESQSGIVLASGLDRRELPSPRRITIAVAPFAGDMPEYEPRHRIAIDVLSLSPLQSNRGRHASAHSYESVPCAPFSEWGVAPVYLRPEYASHPAVRALAQWQEVGVPRANELKDAERVLTWFFTSNPECSAYAVLQAIPGLRATIESLGVSLTDDAFLPVRGRDKYDFAEMRRQMPDYAERWVKARGVLTSAVLCADTHARRTNHTYMTRAIPSAFPVVYDQFESISPV